MAKKKNSAAVEEVLYDYEEDMQKKAILREVPKPEEDDKDRSQDWIRQQIAILRKGLIVDVETMEGAEMGKDCLNLKLMMLTDVNGVTGYNQVTLRMSPTTLNRFLTELNRIKQKQMQEQEDVYRLKD